MKAKNPRNHKYSMKKKSEVLKLTIAEPERKVLQFPKDRIVHPENVNKRPDYSDIPVLDINFDITKNKRVSETLERIIPLILEKLESEGIDISKGEKDSLKDASFFVEAFRSVLYKHHKISHPLQQIADAIFVLTAEGELNNSPSKKIILNLIKE